MKHKQIIQRWRRREDALRASAFKGPDTGSFRSDWQSLEKSLCLVFSQTYQCMTKETAVTEGNKCLKSWGQKQELRPNSSPFFQHRHSTSQPSATGNYESRCETVTTVLPPLLFIFDCQTQTNSYLLIWRVIPCHAGADMNKWLIYLSDVSLFRFTDTQRAHITFVSQRFQQPNFSTQFLISLITSHSLLGEHCFISGYKNWKTGHWVGFLFAHIL